jgi:hypothetical protein
MDGRIGNVLLRIVTHVKLVLADGVIYAADHICTYINTHSEIPETPMRWCFQKAKCPVKLAVVPDDSGPKRM